MSCHDHITVGVAWLNAIGIWNRAVNHKPLPVRFPCKNSLNSRIKRNDPISSHPVLSSKGHRFPIPRIHPPPSRHVNPSVMERIPQLILLALQLLVFGAACLGPQQMANTVLVTPEASSSTLPPYLRVGMPSSDMTLIGRSLAVNKTTIIVQLY